MAGSGRKVLHLLLMCVACSVLLVHGRPMIDTSDIVKDIRDIENILNEAESDNTGDSDDDATTSDSENNEEEEEDDPGKEEASDSSSDSAAAPAAPQNVTAAGNSSSAEPTVTDASNSTATEPANTTATVSAGDNDATKNADIPSNTTAPAAASPPAAADATKNAEVPSNVTESAPSVAPAAPAAANATAPASPSNETTKPGTRDVIGIGQRLTSEQKDTPPEGASATEDAPADVGAPVKTPAVASATNAIQSAADLMNYTAAAILGQKDATAKPESSGASPGLYVSEPPKVEEVKIKTAAADKTDVEEKDDSDEQDEASETASKDESKSKSEEAQNQKKDVAVAREGKVNEKSVANNKNNEGNEDDSEEEGDEEEGEDNGDDEEEGDDDAEKENASEEDREVAIEEQDVPDDRAAAVEEEINGKEETGQRRTMIYPPDADYGQAVRNMQQGPMVVEDHNGPSQNQNYDFMDTAIEQPATLSPPAQHPGDASDDVFRQIPAPPVMPLEHAPYGMSGAHMQRVPYPVHQAAARVNRVPLVHNHEDTNISVLKTQAIDDDEPQMNLAPKPLPVHVGEANPADQVQPLAYPAGQRVTAPLAYPSNICDSLDSHMCSHHGYVQHPARVAPVTPVHQRPMNGQVIHSGVVHHYLHAPMQQQQQPQVQQQVVRKPPVRVIRIHNPQRLQEQEEEPEDETEEPPRPEPRPQLQTLATTHTQTHGHTHRQKHLQRHPVHISGSAPLPKKMTDRARFLQKIDETKDSSVESKEDIEVQEPGEAEEDPPSEDSLPTEGKEDNKYDIEAKGIEAKGFEAKRIEAKGFEAKGIEAKGMEAKGIEAKGIEAKGIEAKGIEEKGIEGKWIEAKGIEGKGIEGKGIESKGIEGKDDDMGSIEGKDEIEAKEDDEESAAPFATIEAKDDNAIEPKAALSEDEEPSDDASIEAKDAPLEAKEASLDYKEPLFDPQEVPVEAKESLEAKGLEAKPEAPLEAKVDATAPLEAKTSRILFTEGKVNHHLAGIEAKGLAPRPRVVKYKVAPATSKVHTIVGKTNRATSKLTNTVLIKPHAATVAKEKVRPLRIGIQDGDVEDLDTNVKTLGVLEEDNDAALVTPHTTKVRTKSPLREEESEVRELAENKALVQGASDLTDSEQEQVIEGLQSETHKDKVQAAAIAGLLGSEQVHAAPAKQPLVGISDAESDASLLPAAPAPAPARVHTPAPHQAHTAVQPPTAGPVAENVAVAPAPGGSVARIAPIAENASAAPVPVGTITDNVDAAPEPAAAAAEPAVVEEDKLAEMPHPTAESTAPARKVAAATKEDVGKLGAPKHVHVGVGTGDVKVEVETSKSVIAKRPSTSTTTPDLMLQGGIKMSEIQRMVHDVSNSIDKTSKKLAAIQGGKRQITPAFTPVVSEPAAVPDIRYPVPSADRYPLGAGYIWPSANYGHQYGGPYAWSKSSTPKKEDGKKTSKSSKSKVEKKKGKSKVAGKENKKVKNGSKKAKIHGKKEKRSSEKHESKHHKTQKRQFLNRPFEERRAEIYGSPFHNGGMEQAGEQPAGEPAGAMPSFGGAGGFPGGGQPSIVGGSSSAMYYPGGGQPIPTYGSDLRGLSMEAYGAAAKRTHVPKVHHHKDGKHKE